MCNFLKAHYRAEPGVVYTEFKEIGDALVKVKHCEFIGTHAVVLGQRETTFLKYKTDNLLDTYEFMRRLFQFAGHE